MADRFSKAVRELHERSPFVCESCGHHDIPHTQKAMAALGGEGLTDRFSEAVEEMAEKSAFFCESCRCATRH